MRHTIKKGRKLFKSKRHGKTRRVQRGGAPIDVIRHKIKVGEYDDETGLGSAKYDSGTYVGHFKNGKRNGRGIYTHTANGSTYDGNWVNDKKQGKGKMTYVNGDVYDGDWVNDKQQGEGLYEFSDGEGGFNESYKGEWKNGEMTGHGTYKFKSGNVYEGKWVNGEKQDGKGKMTYPDGSMYEGEWLNDAKHGKGKMTYEDGNVYDGDWMNGKPHGQGCYEFSDGNGEFDESYKGEWKNGKMHGHGIYRSQSGNVYEGTWANDNKNGQGKMTYANGDVYQGEWDANDMHGQGTMTYHNGDAYEGPWRYGQRHGENGRMRYADGRVYEGEWWKDKMHGDGTMTAANGDVIYEGLWKNDAQIPVFFDPATGKLADNDGYNPPAPIMRFHNSDNMLYTNDKIKGKYQFSDVIYNEEKNVVDELREDPTTIALLLNRTYYVPSTDRLLQLMNDRRLIRYECTKKDTADGFSIDTDVNKTVPYFGLNGIVSNQGGVVPLFDLWAAINSGRRAFELVKTGHKLLTVASHHVAYDYGSWVGSAHCQGDKDADIYELQILRSSEKPRSRNKTRRNSQEDSGTNKRFRAHSYSLHPYNPGR